MITSIHQGLKAILGSARQLVCRTRAREATVLNRGVVVYSIDDPFVLRAAGKLDHMLAHIPRPTKTLILRMGNVPSVDATGIRAVREIVTAFKHDGATVVLVEVSPRLLQKLVRGGVIAQLGSDNVIDTLDRAQTRTKANDLVRYQ